MNGKYALVLTFTMQVDRFVDVDNGCETVVFVDMTNHPQRDTVKEGWYYNPYNNTFYEENPGDIPIPYTKPSDKPLDEATAMAIESRLTAEQTLAMTEIIAKKNEASNNIVSYIYNNTLHTTKMAEYLYSDAGYELEAAFTKGKYGVKKGYKY